MFHWILCRVADGAYNESILGYIERGHFKVRIPTQVNFERFNPDAVGKTDFIGLNYYSNLILSLFMKTQPPSSRTRDRVSCSPTCPTRCTQRASTGRWFDLPLGVPVIVTENGIADDRDDRRALWIQRYIYAMSQAIKDGVDVRGYHYWSLMDNFEWAEGWQMDFGLFAVDRETQARRPREGSLAYRDIIKDHRDDH